MSAEDTKFTKGCRVSALLGGGFSCITSATVLETPLGPGDTYKLKFEPAGEIRDVESKHIFGFLFQTGDEVHLDDKEEVRVVLSNKGSQVLLEPKDEDEEPESVYHKRLSASWSVGDRAWAAKGANSSVIPVTVLQLKDGNAKCAFRLLSNTFDIIDTSLEFLMCKDREQFLRPGIVVQFPLVPREFDSPYDKGMLKVIDADGTATVNTKHRYILPNSVLDKSVSDLNGGDPVGIISEQKEYWERLLEAGTDLSGHTLSLAGQRGMFMSTSSDTEDHSYVAFDFNKKLPLKLLETASQKKQSKKECTISGGCSGCGGEKIGLADFLRLMED